MSNLWEIIGAAALDQINPPESTKLSNIAISFLITEIVTSTPKLANELSKFLSGFKKVLHLKEVNECKTKFSYLTIWLNKVKIYTIIDSGAPGNIVSTRLMKKLQLAPDIAHNQSFGTAGLAYTTSLGAYSMLPLQFGAIQVTALAIVLPNQNYNFLIDKAFLNNHKFNTILWLTSEIVLVKLWLLLNIFILKYYIISNIKYISYIKMSFILTIKIL